ncbi:c-type cytochrome biogenesis protein CcmI [Agaribacterium haliotis]|uniref:c-type cytochrome biogenesis protein CcmI n=1 Tax=Agaribacterium haliotis TaxID=2013869 RepID=UPI000BB56C50|nr:c-type cytochrome biogenesis protein CcmI [Agaribacterium haliotis]
MGFWQVFIVFSLLAVAFLLWPFFRRLGALKRGLREDVQIDLQQTLQFDRREELKQALAAGEISEKDYRDLSADLERDFEQQALQGALNQAVSNGSRSRLIFGGLCLALPLAALLLYNQLGAKPEWQITEISEALYGAHGGSKQLETELLSKLQQRLKQRPESPQLWFMLGSAASSAGNYELSVRAYKELLKLAPESARVHAELAQSLFMRAGNTITPEVRAETQKALELDPELASALGLAGIDAFQSGRYQQAIDLWQSAVKQLDPQSSGAQVLSRGIVRAQAALGQSGASKTSSATASTKAAAGASILVKLSLGDKAAELSGDETVFVYARAWQGAKMPLAIQRLKVSDLPATVELNKDTAMAQGMDISSAPQLEVLARVSLSGTASPQSGDWLASKGPIVLGKKASTVELEINEQLP